MLDHEKIEIIELDPECIWQIGADDPRLRKFVNPIERLINRFIVRITLFDQRKDRLLPFQVQQQSKEKPVFRIRDKMPKPDDLIRHVAMSKDRREHIRLIAMPLANAVEQFAEAFL